MTPLERSIKTVMFGISGILCGAYGILMLILLIQHWHELAQLSLITQFNMGITTILCLGIMPYWVKSYFRPSLDDWVLDQLYRHPEITVQKLHDMAMTDAFFEVRPRLGKAYFEKNMRLWNKLASLLNALQEAKKDIIQTDGGFKYFIDPHMRSTHKFSMTMIVILMVYLPLLIVQEHSPLIGFLGRFWGVIG